MIADDERAFWDSLEGDEVLNNTAGFPPYDVVDVADMICLRMDGSGGGDVLDLGCGIGRLTETLTEMAGWRIIGVDISAKLIEWAKIADGYNTYLVGDGRNVPAECEFDHAYSVTMFQHIPHIAMWGYIHQVRERLPVGGRFVFTVLVGDEPETFLNHQIGDIEAFGDSMRSWFDTVEITHPDERGWTWVTAQK